MSEKLKVLIVDDSALIRVLLSSILGSHPNIEVVGTATDPYDARKKIKKLNPQVLTLDVEMPKMDGITFLRNLMRLHPMPVVMVSTLTEAGADITLEALKIGAFDFVAKPKADVKERLQEMADELVDKVIAAGQCNLGALERDAQQPFKDTAPSIITRRSASPQLIALGASTGGTEALHAVVTRLPEKMPPIVIVQHIPDVFSTSFARRLDRESRLTVREVREKMPIRSGEVYLAPGHCHMVVRQQGNQLFADLHDIPPVNRHKPSVDVLFESVSALDIAAHTMTFLLTGMGADGAQGLLKLKQQGGQTFAQDQASSVVWGMPGAAVKLGAAEQQVALRDIPGLIISSYQ